MNKSTALRSEMEKVGLLPPARIKPGQLYRFPTIGGKKESSGFCQSYQDGLAAIFGDFRVGIQQSWNSKNSKLETQAQKQQRGAERRQIVKQISNVQAVHWARAAAMNATLWKQGIPIAYDDPVAGYLAKRKLHPKSWPAALRFHPALEFWHEGQYFGNFPAMLGAVTNDAGKQVSLHRTYLTNDGELADVPVVKKLTASSQVLDGCSIKLAAPKIIKGRLTLGIAQSIESALACADRFSIPTVAVCFDLGVRNFCVPEAVEALDVYRDNTMKFSDAIESLVYKPKIPSRTIRRDLSPPVTGISWADYLAAKAKG